MWPFRKRAEPEPVRLPTPRAAEYLWLARSNRVTPELRTFAYELTDHDIATLPNAYIPAARLLRERARQSDPFQWFDPFEHLPFA